MYDFYCFASTIHQDFKVIKMQTKGIEYTSCTEETTEMTAKYWQNICVLNKSTQVHMKYKQEHNGLEEYIYIYIYIYIIAFYLLMP